MEFNISVWFAESGVYGRDGHYNWHWNVTNGRQSKNGERWSKRGAHRAAKQAARKIAKTQRKLKRIGIDEQYEVN